MDFSNINNICFFGGSITEGAGAKNLDNCYRSLVSNWILKNNKNAKFYNAAIGGTGSDLGVFRLEHDVLINNPDIVFIEFAVNDYTCDTNEIKINIESIIRKIKTKNIQTKIIFIFTLMNDMVENEYKHNKIPNSVLAHIKICDYYDIPYINVGKSTFDKISNENIDILKILPDNVHPSDFGHIIYSEMIIDFLENLHYIETYTIKNPVNLYLRLDARLVDSFLVNDKNFLRNSESLKGRYERHISCNVPNAEFTFNFTGDTIGLYWLIAYDSGDIYWSIDGEPWERCSSFDKYALKFDRVNYTILKNYMPYGRHILKVKVANEKNEESKGNFIRIAAFLVN